MTGKATGTPRLALLEHLPEMVTISDREGRILYANPATEHVCGYAPEEFVGRQPFDTIHPEDRPRCEEAFAELLGTSGLSLEIEHRVRHKDGSWRWVEGTFASLFEDAEVGGLLATVRDVSGRKRTEEALLESEERQAFLLELSDALRAEPGADAVADRAIRMLFEKMRLDRCYIATYRVEDDRADFTHQVGNDSVPPLPDSVRLSDFPDAYEQVRGRTFVVEDDFERQGLSEAERANSENLGMRAMLASTARKGDKYPLSSLMAVSGSPRRWTRDEIALVEEVAERTWVAMERARAEEASRESGERYRFAVEAADLGRWELTPKTGGFHSCPTCNRHLGLPQDAQPTLDEHFENIHPQDHATIRENLRRAVEESGEYEAEYRVVHPGGVVRRILSRARLLRYAGSAPDTLTGVTLDVTEARELEEERERSRARELATQTEAAERERIGRELHDRVAHTMGVAHQSMELHAALAARAPERAAEKLDLARKATRTALDETRDLSAQLARRQAEETRDGLTSALRDLLQTHLPESMEGNLSAKGEEEALPKPVREQAYLVMREAVRNAVTHSGCKRIGVSVEVEGGELRGRVEEDGQGFEPDDGENGGPAAGVGLRSMRERTEMLGGRLEISSKPGRGSTVEVRIPLAN